MEAALAAHKTHEKPVSGSLLDLCTSDLALQEELMATVAQPTCSFADFPLMLRLVQNAVMKWRTRPECLKAFVMVRARHAGDLSTGRSRKVTWNLVQCGLQSACCDVQVAALEVCFREFNVAPTFYWRFMVEHVLARAVTRRSKRSPVLARAMLKLVGKALPAYKKSSPLLENAATKIIKACIGHHLQDSTNFLPVIVNTVPLSSRVWTAIVRDCLLNENWRRLCADEEGLCRFMEAGGPRIILDGSFAMPCGVHVNYGDEMVQAWACVLARCSWRVTCAWMQGCFAHPSVVGEMVLLSLVASSPGLETARVADCLEAVAKSLRLWWHNVFGKTYVFSKPYVVDACAAIVSAWRPDPAFTSKACYLLGILVTFYPSLFADNPAIFEKAMDCVHPDVFCSDDGSYCFHLTRAGLQYCAKLKNPRLVAAFHEAAWTLALFVADDGFVRLRELCALCDAPTLDYFCSTLILLADYAPSRAVVVDMLCGLLRAGFSIMTVCRTLKAIVPTRKHLRAIDLSLVIHTLAQCMYHSVTMVFDAGLLTDIAKLRDKDQLSGAPFVHPVDVVWNTRLFIVLSGRLPYTRSWMEELLPFVYQVPLDVTMQWRALHVDVTWIQDHLVR